MNRTTESHGQPAGRFRRFTLRCSFAAGVAAVIAVLGAQATANAEWDIGQYDRCIAEVKFHYREGDISTADMVQGYDTCCISSGGQLNGPNCGAPPAIPSNAAPTPASEAANPDVPSGTPPSKSKPTFTLAPIAPVP